MSDLFGAQGRDLLRQRLDLLPPHTAYATQHLLEQVEAAFRYGLESIVLEAPAGAASALKMAYAAYTKGTAALVMAIRALSIAEGVDDALRREWERSQPDLPARSEAAVTGSARKAWRFVGEMDEIAATFAATGLPDGFHRAAAEIYHRLADFKDSPSPLSVAEVASALVTAPRTT